MAQISISSSQCPRPFKKFRELHPHKPTLLQAYVSSILNASPKIINLLNDLQITDDVARVLNPERNSDWDEQAKSQS